MADRALAPRRAGTPGPGRIALDLALVLWALVFLLRVYVMLVNSLKPLDEIRDGDLLAWPIHWPIAPWLSAWSQAQIGVQPTGLKPYFVTSFLLAPAAVLLSTLIGAINGYILP